MTTVSTVPACGREEPLVSGSIPIPDAFMTASSEYDRNWAASFARLSGTNAWRATIAERDALPSNFYIQVSYWLISV